MKGCNFKGGWGEVYGRVWREEKELKGNYNLKTVIMKTKVSILCHILIRYPDRIYKT